MQVCAVLIAALIVGHGGHIAVDGHLVGAILVELAALLIPHLDGLHLAIRAAQVDLIRDAGDVGRAVVISAADSLQQLLDLGAGKVEDHHLVAEGIEAEHIAHRHASLGERLVAHTAAILYGNVGARSGTLRVGHHAAQLLLRGESVRHLRQHTVEEGVVAELIDHHLNGRIDAGAVSDADQVRLLVDNLTVLQLQLDFGDVRQLLARLRDQHAAVQMVALERRVRVSTDDEVSLGEDLGQLNVRLIAVVSKQDQYVAAVTQPFVLRRHVVGIAEGDAPHGVRVSVWNAVAIDLYEPEDAEADAIALEELVWLDVQPERIVGIHVGAYVAEVGEVDQLAKAVELGVELMISDGREVEADAVHQRHHGIARDGIHVVDRVARAIVAA